MRHEDLALVMLLRLCVAPAAADPRPAIDGDRAFVVSYLSSFVDSCVKQVHAAPPVPVAACACVAALTADRFTTQELAAVPQHPDILTKIHPETETFIAICAEAAKAMKGR